MKKSIEGNLVKFTFNEGVEPLVFDCEKMSDSARLYAISVGMSHRLGDLAAIPKSEANNFRVTEAMRREAIAEGATHYEGGVEVDFATGAGWNLKASTRKAPQNQAILKLAARLGVSYQQAEEAIANDSLADLIKA